MNYTLLLQEPWLRSSLVFLGGVLVSWLSIPWIIKSVTRFHLLDSPDDRKAHKIPTPTMGGISFVIVFFLFCGFWKYGLSLDQFVVIAGGVLILFPVGLLDDTKGISAIRKLLLEMALAAALVHVGFSIKNLRGVFNLHELSLPQQYLLNVPLIAGLINAFNLIDGINGLAGGLGFINSAVFGTLFLLQGNLAFALFSFAFAGALLGFLRYNFHKAKIFMGDTGSLHLGFVMAVLGLKALEGDTIISSHPDILFLVSAIWLVPVFDTLRVFSVRILKGMGPFTPDKRHVHHLLLKSGMDHRKASISLYVANMLLIASVALSPFVNATFNFVLTWATAIVLIELLTVYRLSSFYRQIKRAFQKTTQVIYGRLYIQPSNNAK